jgi:hypothetical protein
LSVYQFSIRLRGYRLAIWRRGQVKDCLLIELHEIILGNRSPQPFLTAGVVCKGPGQVRPFAKELSNGTFGRFGEAAAVAAAVAAI